MADPAPQLARAWEPARDAGVLAQLPYDPVPEPSGAHADRARHATVSTSTARAVHSDVARRGVAAVFRDGAPDFAVLAADRAARERVLVAGCDGAVAHVDAARRRGGAPGAPAPR